MPNFVSIKCYLLFDPWNHLLCMILKYKNLKLKNLIDNIVIDLWLFWNFANIEDIKRKCNPMVDLSNSNPLKNI